MFSRNTFEYIYQSFKDKNCELYLTKDDYENIKKPMAEKLSYQASCGHDNTVTLTNFIHKGSGLICKQCVYKNLADSVKNRVLNGNEIELLGYTDICEICKEDFDIERTNEGCKADVIIKPKYIEEDKWMMIQLKITQKAVHNLYSFHINNSEYTDCIIMCYCIQDKLFWILDNNIVKSIKKINIGLTDRSEYYKYQISDNAILLDFLHNKYTTMTTFTKDYAKLPIAPNQLLEHKYRLFREKSFPYLNFEYPLLQASKTDFFINDYKIQEKVAPKKNTNTSIGFMSTCAVRNKSKRRYYKKGNNDYYWYWLKDNLEDFYIFPENVLDKYLYSDDNQKPTQAICINDKNWTIDYKYNLNDPDIKEKILKLFV
jgi:hypothetical protein